MAPSANGTGGDDGAYGRTSRSHRRGLTCVRCYPAPDLPYLPLLIGNRYLRLCETAPARDVRMRRAARGRVRVVGDTRFELVTSSVSTRRSPPELTARARVLYSRSPAHKARGRPSLRVREAPITMSESPSDSTQNRILVADVAWKGSGSAPDVLTYRIAPRFRETITEGAQVCVTVQNRQVMGYVTGIRLLPDSDPLASRLVDIADVVDGVEPLAPDELDMGKWLAARWLARLGDALSAVRPASMAASLVRSIVLTEAGRDAVEAGTLHSKPAALLGALVRCGGRITRDAATKELGPGATDAFRVLRERGLAVEEVSQLAPSARRRPLPAVSLGTAPEPEQRLSASARKILAFLADSRSPVPVAELLRETGTARTTVTGLIRRGYLAPRTVMVERDPLAARPVATSAPPLTPEQSAAIAVILAEVASPPSSREPVLVHGVTASGKTEVYLEAIRRIRAQGKGAIVLVPEIALATQVVEVIAGRLGRDVAVLHSRLSSGERHDEWKRVSEGRAGVAVGARSAVFAPVPNLGLIIIDEEHEPAYKQESAPYYHARDVAQQRARQSGATLVLGSATPSLETYLAASEHRLRLAVLETRASGAPLPAVTVVDMREEFKSGAVLFSRALVEAVRARLDAKQQVLLFLNRRGYAQFVLCRDCGYIARCPDCAVSLTLHAASRRLRCHHCGHSVRAPDLCPSCSGHRLRGFGLGTERVEQDVMRLFPDARLARMDRDTTSRKGSHARIIQSVRAGQADILIGTQMVAKGLDFPKVTLVGVVSADTGLHIPDFRASERTFQTLYQVAGRAGRGQIAGEVVIQTFTPEHYAVESAARQDYAGFYAKEIEQRRELRYPPFAHLANVVATGADPEAARQASAATAEALRSTAREECEVIGPAPSALERLRGKHRWHVVVRAHDRDVLPEALACALSRVPSGLRSLLTVDIDPVSLA